LLGEEHTQAQLTDRIAHRLSLYLLVFVFEWCFGLINRILGAVCCVLFFPTLLHCLVVPLQGWLNSVIYGHLHGDLGCRGSFGGSFSSGFSSSSLGRPSVFRSASAHKFHRLKEQKRRSIDTARELLSRTFNETQDVSFYVCTWNMGECDVPNNIGDLVPGDFDMYVIGVQECLVLEELTNELMSQMGEEYSLHSLELGSSQTVLGFHGFIALICFVRRDLEESGVVERLDIASTSVKRGVNLGETEWRKSRMCIFNYFFGYGGPVMNQSVRLSPLLCRNDSCSKQRRCWSFLPNIRIPRALPFLLFLI
jgi:hypothetical protein